MTKPCDKCGYNPDKLTEYMKTVIPKPDFDYEGYINYLETWVKSSVPKSKIEARIKELEAALPDTYSIADETLAPDIRALEELRNLLSTSL